MLLLVVLILVICAIFFFLLFIHLHRIYKQLKIKHKPPPSSNGLEQRPELAFVLAHGVEAYNEQRRQRRLQRLASGSNHDSQSISSATSDISEPLPAYTTASNSDPPAIATAILIPSSSTTISHPLDNSNNNNIIPPPMYIYQPPSSRSAVQSALLTTDNSPSVSILNHSGGTQPELPIVGDHQTSQRRRSGINVILPRGRRPSNQRSLSLSSSSSSSLPPSSSPIADASSSTATVSVTIPMDLPPSCLPEDHTTLQDTLSYTPVIIDHVVSPAESTE